MILNLIDTWQFNFLGYLLFSVIFSQFYKLSVKTVKRDGAATILLQTIGGLSILLLTPLFSIKFPSDLKFYILLIFACVFYALFDRLQTSIRKNLEVSVFSILNQFSYVFVIVIGLLIFREPLLFSKLLGAFLIVIGNAVIFYQKGRFNWNKYNVLALFSTLVFATAISIDIGISNQFNLPIYIMLTLIVPSLFIAITERIHPKESLAEFNNGNKFFFLITGFAWGLLIFFLLRAFRFGQVTVVAPLQATSVMANVIVAYLFLKESNSLKKKLLAAALISLGIFSITAL